MALLKQTRRFEIALVVGICLQAVACVALGQSVEVSVTNRPPVGLIVLDKLMSGRSRVGDQVHYETLANVFDKDHQVLIPAGSYAYGTVTRSKGSGMFGKRGQLQFTCEYAVLPNGDHVPLTGSSIGGSGTNDIGQTAAVALLVSPLGLLIKGGTLIVSQGTPITMYVADGARITPSSTTPPGLRADFAMRGKNASDIIGEAISFDGKAYTVQTDSGAQRTLVLSDIASVSFSVPPPRTQ